MLHLLVLYGKYPEMVDLLINAGIDYHLSATLNESSLYMRNTLNENLSSLRAIHLGNNESLFVYIFKKYSKI